MAHRGRIVPELADERVREIFVKGHRLIYRVAEDRVWALALIRGFRDFRRAWRERPRS